MDLFNKILHAAVEGHASDVHIKIGTPVILRINRQLIAVDSPLPTAEWMDNVVEHIVPKHARAKLEAEREVDFSYFVHGVGRFRTNLFQQRGEWCLAMRYVKTNVPSFEELGLLPVLRSIAETHRGIVLLAGTTGCGKSTTLAAMIEHINSNFKKHIITLEDPIEYVFEDNQSVVEQREIGLDSLSFQHALKHVLRQDPDVIMVGEIRDVETAQTAVRAANSGHLVLATMHAPISAAAVQAMLNLNVHPHHLASSLLGVIAQRLVRTLNPETRVKYDMSAVPHLFTDVQRLLEPGQGAQIYGPGPATTPNVLPYTGRTGVFEVMSITPPMRHLIATQSPAHLIRHRSIEEGMIGVRQAALLAVARGITSVEEVFRVVPAEFLLDE
jgi:pilus retraction protein PilT